MTIDGVLNIILICLIVITVVQMEGNFLNNDKGINKD